MGGRPIASLICVTIAVLPNSPRRERRQLPEHFLPRSRCCHAPTFPHCLRPNSYRRQLCCWPCPWSSCRGCHLSARTVLPFVNFCPGSKVEKKLWLALAPARRPPHSTPQ